MKFKYIQAAVVSLLVLLIGMVLGGLIVGAIFNSHIQQLKNMRTTEGFVDQIASIIEPKDPTQKAALDEILIPIGKQMETTTANHRKKVAAIMSQMQADLDSQLTPAQRLRLDAAMKRWGREYLK